MLAALLRGTRYPFPPSSPYPLLRSPKVSAAWQADFCLAFVFFLFCCVVRVPPAFVCRGCLWGRQAGCSLDNVVRTRMYVTDIKNAEKVMAEHCKVFSNIRPAATLISVSLWTTVPSSAVPVSFLPFPPVSFLAFFPGCVSAVLHPSALYVVASVQSFLSGRVVHSRPPRRPRHAYSMVPSIGYLPCCCFHVYCSSCGVRVSRSVAGSLGGKYVCREKFKKR